MGGSGFSERFGGLLAVMGVGCGLGVVRRAACLVVGPVVVGGCASLFGCTTAVRASGPVAASSWGFGRWVGAWRCIFGLARRGSAVGFRLLWRAVELAVSARLCLLWWLVWFLCFRFGALAGLGAFVRAGFLCVFLLGVASGPRVGLAGCRCSLSPPVVYSTGRSGAVVPVLVLLFVALWFILRGDLLCIFPCVILFLCFSVLLILRLPRLGCLFGFVGFLFLLGSGNGCGL